MENERWLVASIRRPANHTIGGTPASLSACFRTLKALDRRGDSTLIASTTPPEPRIRHAARHRETALHPHARGR